MLHALLSMLGFWTRAPQPRRTLIFASVTHVWNDLFFALFYPLLPLIKDDLDLSFTEVALLKSVYAGALAAFQVPAGLLAEQVGEFWLLIGGNIWVALGLIGMAAVPSYLFLLAMTLIGGLGGGMQHPPATSMVSRAYDDRGRATAVGTVNFAGDLGKMAAPAIALLVAVNYGWRAAMRTVGVAGIVFMALLAFVRRSVETGAPPAAKTGVRGEDDDATQMGAFVALSGIGFLDSGLRGAALTFLPFIMEDKGMSAGQMLAMLIVVLAGGAIGKYVCGRLSDLYGSLRVIWGTKALTALLLLAILPTPPLALVPLMLVLGIGLNGTSSALYATVASFVPRRRRARMYGSFYTTNEVGTVLAPLFFGRLADLFNIRASMIAMGLATALILPASLPLRKHLTAPAARQSRP